MSELMNAIRERAERAKNQESRKSKIDFFKPKKGENLIRILPHWETLDDSKLNFVERRIHFLPMRGKNDRFIKIPARKLSELNEEDLVDRYYDELEAKDPEAAKDLRSRHQVLFNIVEYDAVKRNENPIKVWAISRQLAEKLWLQAQEAGSSCVNIDADYDWKVFKNVDPKKGPIHGVSYEVILGRQKTAIPQVVKDQLGNMTNLETVYTENLREYFIKIISSILGRDITNEVGPSVPAAPQPVQAAPQPVQAVPQPVQAAPQPIEEDVPYGPTAEPTATTNIEDDDISKELKDLGVTI